MASSPELLREVGAVTRESADLDEFALPVHRRHSVDQRHDLPARGERERVGRDPQGVGTLALHPCERRVEAVAAAHLDHEQGDAATRGCAMRNATGCGGSGRRRIPEERDTAHAWRKLVQELEVLREYFGGWVAGTPVMFPPGLA
jgi:hypothetical protein